MFMLCDSIFFYVFKKKERNLRCDVGCSWSCVVLFDFCFPVRAAVEVLLCVCEEQLMCVRVCTNSKCQQRSSLFFAVKKKLPLCGSALIFTEFCSFFFIDALSSTQRIFFVFGQPLTRLWCAWQNTRFLATRMRGKPAPCLCFSLLRCRTFRFFEKSWFSSNFACNTISLWWTVSA